VTRFKGSGGAHKLWEIEAEVPLPHHEKMITPEEESDVVARKTRCIGVKG